MISCKLTRPLFSWDGSRREGERVACETTPKSTTYKLVILLGHHYCTCFSLVRTCTCTCITIMSGGRGILFLCMHLLLIIVGREWLVVGFFLMECGLRWLLHIGHMAHQFSRRAQVMHICMYMYIYIYIGCMAHCTGPTCTCTSTSTCTHEYSLGTGSLTQPWSQAGRHVWLLNQP